MSGWLFMMVTINGFTGMAEKIETFSMTEAQCKQAIVQLYPLRKGIGAVCLGPEGQAFTFKDVRE